jgi:Kelch motif
MHMRRTGAALLLFLVFLAASGMAITERVSATFPDSWTTKAPMQQSRTGLGVAVVNGKIYAIGGCNISGFMPSIDGSVVLGYANLEELGAFLGINEEYDPDADDWITRASMPTPRILFAVAVYQNRIYCIGGKTSTGLTRANEVYDPVTDTWEEKAAMPTARGLLTAGVVNGKIYLIGGEPDGTLNQVYDPATDSWDTKASKPIAAGSVSVVIDDKIYVIGSTLQTYDPQTDDWSQSTPTPSNISGVVGAGVTTGVLAPKRIYVIGPQRSNEQSNCVYDPENSSWTLAADFPARRFNFGVAVVNDMLYAIGGHTYDPGHNGYVETAAANEQYTPIGYGNPEPTPIPTITPEPTPEVAPFPPVSVFIITVAVAVLVSAGLLVYFRKHHRSWNP